MTMQVDINHLPSYRNFTVEEYSSYCETLTHLNFHSPYIWSSISKVVSSVAAMPVIAYMVATKKLMLYNEINPLIYFKALVLFIYAFNTVIARGLQVVELAIYKNTCDRIKFTTTCVYMKAVNYASTVGISATMLFLVIDAAFELWIPNKKKKQMLSRFLFITLIFIYCAVVCFYCLVDSQGNHMHIHCFEDSPLTKPYSLWNTLSMIAMDAVNVSLSIGLWVYCKKELRLNRVDLNRTFDVRHSLTVVKAFFPLTAYHTVTLAMYNAASLVLRLPCITDNIDRTVMKEIQAFANIIPYYVFVAPILLMVVLRKIKNRRDAEIFHSMRPSFNGKVVPEGKLYFDMLHKTWSAHTVTTNWRSSGRKKATRTMKSKSLAY